MNLALAQISSFCCVQLSKPHLHCYNSWYISN